MELGVPATMHSGLTRRAAPIVAGGGLVAAAGFVATHDPASASSPFPACVFHQATGLWCPGCGLTRGTYQLLHGHIGAALSYNIFTPVAVAVLVIAWLGWLRVSWGVAPLRVPAGFGRWVAIVLPGMLVLYGVLRNLPIAPLRSLAP